MTTFKIIFHDMETNLGYIPQETVSFTRDNAMKGVPMYFEISLRRH
jgi:hypothetical protein